MQHSSTDLNLSHLRVNVKTTHMLKVFQSVAKPQHAVNGSEQTDKSVFSTCAIAKGIL